MNENTISDIIKASIWKTRPVDQEPEIKLVRWSIMETERNERHFVGYNASWREGRVSSRIEEFDPKTRRGVTHSGRVYELVGPSGYDGDAAYVWGIWCRGYKVENPRNVSEEITLLMEQEVGA